MSQDWWPGGSTSSNQFSTPTRPYPSTNTQYLTPQPPISQSHSTRARFAGDELDPADQAQAENVKFYPTFSSTAAGKAFQGNASGMSSGSPGFSTSGQGSFGAGGGGGGAGAAGGGVSPGGVRRSPQHRFSLGASPNDAMSPRRMTGRAPYTPASPPDDDLPPTMSLRDTPSSPQPIVSPPTSSQPPSSFTSLPSSQTNNETTTLNVFGLPPDQLPNLYDWLAECGQIESYGPAIEGGWVYQVTYSSPVGASFALRRHGEVVGGRYMVGFKIVEKGSEQKISGQVSVPGGKIIVQDKGNVMKAKNATVSSNPGSGQTKKDGYAWDENEPTSGMINKAAEWLFGR